MTYEEYKNEYFTESKPRYQFVRGLSAALYTPDYPKALEFYSRALGPPQYVEGRFTRGWKIGPTWLTLFPAEAAEAAEAAGAAGPQADAGAGGEAQTAAPAAKAAEVASTGGTAGGSGNNASGSSLACRRVELQFHMKSRSEALALRQAFIDAGASGPEPSEEIMYVPLLFAALTDPFGNELLITADLIDESIAGFPESPAKTSAAEGDENRESAAAGKNMPDSPVLAGILESFPDPVVFVDCQHIIRYVNRPAREYWEDRGDLVGRSIFECHNPQSKAAMLEIFARLEAGEKEVCYSNKPEKRIYMTGVFDSADRVIGYWERYEYPQGRR